MIAQLRLTDNFELSRSRKSVNIVDQISSEIKANSDDKGDITL